MKKKYLVIASIIVILIIVVFIIINISLDFNNEDKIKKEVTEIVNLLQSDSIPEDKINEILDRRLIKKGNYLKVEESIKAYYRDIYLNISNLNFLMADDNYSNYLTGSNLKDDRPSFIKSKENLNNTQAQINIEFNACQKKITEESTKMLYIADKDLRNYYIDFFITLTKEIDNEEFINNQSTKVKNNEEKIKVYHEAYSFLIANRGHWDIRSDELIFDETTYYEEYATITNKLK